MHVKYIFTNIALHPNINVTFHISLPNVETPDGRFNASSNSITCCMLLFIENLKFAGRQTAHVCLQCFLRTVFPKGTLSLRYVLNTASRCLYSQV